MKCLEEGSRTEAGENEITRRRKNMKKKMNVFWRQLLPLSCFWEACRYMLP